MAMQVSALAPVAARAVQTHYRRIGTPIPVPESIAGLERLRAVEPKSMQGMPPVVWAEASGFLIRDPYGNQWIDLTSGIVMANTGHAHPRVMEAIRKQIESPLVFSYAFPTGLRRRALERVAALAPGENNKAILFSSGTEATECCLSLIRKHGLSISPAKTAVVSFESCYHGRTLGARMASGQPGLIDGLDRAAARYFQLPLPEAGGFESAIGRLPVPPEEVAGVVLESIPGWNTTPHPRAYIDHLMRWARTHRILVACDEIQSGIGRTGRMFAFEHYGITPDLIACGKGLSSTVPASAVIGPAAILDLAAPGEMSSTFGGNPISAAAVLANLEVMDAERLVERSASLGRTLGAALERMCAPFAGWVGRCNGSGLFYSLHLRDPRSGEPLVELCDEIAMEAVRRGVMLFVTGKGMIKFSPPLIIEEDALQEAVGVVGEIVRERLAEVR